MSGEPATDRSHARRWLAVALVAVAVAAVLLLWVFPWVADWLPGQF